MQTQTTSAATWNTQPRSEFGELAAIQMGRGIDILLLHGVGLRSEAWNEQIKALKERYSVIAPDMPGHGESPPLQGKATLTTYTERIVEALDGTTSNPLFVVGHSMGAMIALNLASNHPTRVHGLVALNAVYRRKPTAAAAVRQRANALDGVNATDPSGPLKRWFKDDASPEALACSEWLTEVSPAGYKTAYSVFAHSDGPADEDLKALACPALFMTGADDPNSTPTMSEAMAAHPPNGRSVVLDNAAHMMPMTHPEKVNSSLLTFLAHCLE
ncbi:MAG: alpha/beta hydrolase [Pseudomonadota bacterium]